MGRVVVATTVVFLLLLVFQEVFGKTSHDRASDGAHETVAGFLPGYASRDTATECA